MPCPPRRSKANDYVSPSVTNADSHCLPCLLRLRERTLEGFSLRRAEPSRRGFEESEFVRGDRNENHTTFLGVESFEFRAKLSDDGQMIALIV